MFRPRRYVEVDEDRRSGYPVIAGTRIPYDTVAGLVRDGVAPDAVSDYFPSVSAAAADDALSFAEYVDGYRRPLLVA